jgi:hypothetical protein
VIGHLRFGRHPRGDGTYAETIEFVRAHQRGLNNELYIPSVHKVDSGKIISDQMKRYWRQSNKPARPP